MKKLVLIMLGMFIFIGCVSKTIIKKNNSISTTNQQRQDANQEWNKLDKEK